MKVKIPTGDAAHQAKVLKRYQVGTSVRGSLVTAVEAVGDVVMVTFEAAANMVLVVFGVIHDYCCSIGCRPTLITGDNI